MHHFRKLFREKGECERGRYERAVPSPWLHRDHSSALDSVRVLSATNSLSKTVTIASDCTYRTSVSCRGALEVRRLEALLMEASPRQRSRYYDLTQKKQTTKTLSRRVKGRCSRDVFKFSLKKTSTVIFAHAWACLVNWINQTTCRWPHPKKKKKQIFASDCNSCELSPPPPRPPLFGLGVPRTRSELECANTLVFMRALAGREDAEGTDRQTDRWK